MVFSSVPPLLCAFGSCTLNRTSWTTRDHLQETRQFGVGCPFSRRTPYFGKLACDIEDGQTRILLSHSFFFFHFSPTQWLTKRIRELVDSLRIGWCVLYEMVFFKISLATMNVIKFPTVVSYSCSNETSCTLYNTYNAYAKLSTVNVQILPWVTVGLKFRQTHLTFRSMTRDFFLFFVVHLWLEM